MRCNKIQRLGDDRIENGIRSRNRLRTSNGPELKFVPGKREWTGAIAIAGVFGKFRQHADADLHSATGLGGLRGSLFQLSHDVFKLIAQENRNDRGWGFVRSETMVVARMCDRDSQ